MLAVASPAGAATVRHTTLRGGLAAVFAAAPGEANDLRISVDASGATFTDAGSAVTAGPGCEASAPGTVTCPTVLYVRARLGDGDDRVIVVGSPPEGFAAELYGQDGNDVLTGGPESDSLTGGPGNDVVSGGAGNDGVSQGSDAGAQDQLDGGPGEDTISYGDATSGAHVDLVAGTAGGGGEEDRIAGFEDIGGSRYADVLLGDDGPNEIAGSDIAAHDIGGDRIDGRGGDDRLVGSHRDDHISGGAGDDSVESGGGADRLDLGPGDDIIQPGNEPGVRARCGPGYDFFDAFGGPIVLSSDCERMISQFGTILLRARRGRLVLTFPNEGCDVTLRLGRRGPQRHVPVPRGHRRVSFRLPRRRGSVGIWARPDCQHRGGFALLFGFALG